MKDSLMRETTNRPLNSSSRYVAESGSKSILKEKGKEMTNEGFGLYLNPMDYG